MNIIDYIIIVILLIFALKGFKEGLIPSIVNLLGMFLLFIISFYLKQPISVFLYENLPFISFGGIFKGIVTINILFYESIAYGLTYLLLGIIFIFIKKISRIINGLFKVTILLNLPSKIIGAVVGGIEGLLICFILLFIGSLLSQTTKYVNESKYSSIILNDLPIINNVTNKLVDSSNEIYNVVLKNKNDKTKANLESIDTLMKYDILSYKSATKLVKDKKLNIDGIEQVIDKYKENV